MSSAIELFASFGVVTIFLTVAELCVSLIIRYLRNVAIIRESRNSARSGLASLLEEIRADLFEIQGKRRKEPVMRFLGLSTQVYALILASSVIAYGVMSFAGNRNEITVVGVMLARKWKAYITNQFILSLALGSYVGFHIATSGSMSPILIGVLVVLMFATYADRKLMEYRIGKGWYGRNAFEALEIISFITNHPDKDDFGDGVGRKGVLNPEQLEELKHESLGEGGLGALP